MRCLPVRIGGGNRNAARVRRTPPHSDNTGPKSVPSRKGRAAADRSETAQLSECQHASRLQSGAYAQTIASPQVTTNRGPNRGGTSFEPPQADRPVLQIKRATFR